MEWKKNGKKTCLLKAKEIPTQLHRLAVGIASVYLCTDVDVVDKIGNWK